MTTKKIYNIQKITIVSIVRLLLSNERDARNKPKYVGKNVHSIGLIFFTSNVLLSFINLVIHNDQKEITVTINIIIMYFIRGTQSFI